MQSFRREWPKEIARTIIYFGDVPTGYSRKIKSGGEVRRIREIT